MSQEEIEALMNGADDFSNDATESVQDEVAEDNIDDILAGIDGIEDNTENSLSNDTATGDNFDDILAGIDGIEDNDVSNSETVSKDTTMSTSTENIEELIDEAKYPLPVKDENKVVSQLNEVAEDSEQKASQIFDVLSFILDENAKEQDFTGEVQNYVKKQIELLESLNNKFPNIEIFKENLELSKNVIELAEANNSRIDGENNKIFEAMELMQYHDINRQKIERVMAVIKKLNDYLNGIFEDNSDKPEVQIAKHISGDSNETVNADDLESLINQFSEEN
jgi:hypothetical protein